MSNPKLADSINVDTTKWVKVGDAILNLDAIAHMRPGRSHDEQDWVINISAMKQLQLSDEDGKKIWALLEAKAAPLSDISVA